MISSARQNSDGTVTFLDENGMTVLNAPADHPMVSQKLQELASKPPGAGGTLNMPGQGTGGMGPAIQNGQITPNESVAQMGLNLPPPTTIDRQTMGPGAPPPGYGPPGYGRQPPSPHAPPRNLFGQGSSEAGLQGGMSRGMHALANGIGGRIVADRQDRKDQADYDRFTQLAGQAGTPAPIDPAEQRAYEETHSRMAKERAEELKATTTDLHYPGPVPVRKPGPGERIDPATGAVLPNTFTDEERKREEEGLGG